MAANTGVFGGKREAARQATRTASPDCTLAGTTTSIATELAGASSASVCASQPPWAKALVGAIAGLRRGYGEHQDELDRPMPKCRVAPTFEAHHATPKPGPHAASEPARPWPATELAFPPRGFPEPSPRLCLAGEMGSAMACRLLPPR